MISGVITKETVPNCYVCKQTELVTEDETYTFDELLVNELPPPALSSPASVIVLIGDTKEKDIKTALIGCAVHSTVEISAGVYKHCLSANDRDAIDMYEVTYETSPIVIEALTRCLNASTRKAEYVPINDSTLTQLMFPYLQDLVYDASSAAVYLHLPMNQSESQSQQFALSQSFMQWKSSIQGTDTQQTKTRSVNNADSMARMAIRRYRNIHNLLKSEFSPRIELLNRQTLESRATAEQAARLELSEAELAVKECERAIESNILIRDALVRLSESCEPTITIRPLREELLTLTASAANPRLSNATITEDLAIKVHGQRAIKLLQDSTQLDDEVTEIKQKLAAIMVGFSR